MKNIQLLRWKAIVLVESVDDYKGGKDNKFTSINYLRLLPKLSLCAVVLN